MKIESLKIKDVIVFRPEPLSDKRGIFMENYLKKDFESIAGMSFEILQENISISSKGVLRGLHYQVEPYEQGKILQVLDGEIYDVAVDLRVHSKTYSNWVGYHLSGKSHDIIWIPPGFAHGFQVISNTAKIAYKCSNYYSKNHERTILWNDKELNIDWPISKDIVISQKDQNAQTFKNAEKFVT